MDYLKSSFHIHSSFCDGDGMPKDYLYEAKQRNFYIIGFSSHCPLPFKSEWNMDVEQFPEYLKCINKLRNLETEVSASEIPEILIGLEVDYIPGVSGPSNINGDSARELKLDYTIGSVHYGGADPSSDKWCFDAHEPEFSEGLHVFYNNSFMAMAERYYSLLREMVINDPPDIIGHLDLIRKHEKSGEIFCFENPEYRDMVLETLHQIAESRCILEVNTGGISRGYMNTPYPDTWILKEAFKLNIPITLNSDAHSPDAIDAGYHEALKIIADAGYSELTIIRRGGARESVKFR